MTTTVVSDSFNRTSTTTLGNADTGQAWSVTAGTWGTNGTQAYVVSTPGNTNATVDSTYSDCTVQVTVSATGDVRLLWRATAENACFWLLANGTASYTVQKKTPSGVTTLASISQVPVVGDVMSVTLSGSTHTVYINGTQVAQFTDTFNQTVTTHGMRTGSTGSGRWDNFSVTTSGGTANTITLSDSITTSDSVALVRTLHVAISDSITSSDTIANAVGNALTFSDSVSSSDSLTTAQAHAYALSFSDGITTSDSDTKAASESLHDAITATDAMSQVRTYFRNYADSMATSDSLTKQMARALALSDGVTVTDALTAQKVTVYSIHLSDSISVTDAITGLNRILSIALSDSVNTSDSVTMTGGKILNPIRGSIQLLASLNNKITFLASLNNQISLQAGVGPVDGQNFSIKQYSSDVLTFTYSGDLTGCTLEWIMQYNVNSATPLIKKTSADGISITSTSSTQSVFTVSITNTDMANIGQGNYYHQASLVDALGESNPISTGTVTVSAASNN